MDVAVIGAGVTGITAAWLLKQEGFRVALLDRRQVGGVDTGCTSAHLTAVLDTDLTTLASTFGHAGAQAIWDAGLAAIDRIESLIEECEIECGFRRVPGFHHAAVDADDDTVAKEAKRLRAEASLAKELGFNVEVVGSTPLMNQPGWRIDDQAIFNPRAYLKDLLRRIPGNGSIVCEQSEVTFTDVAKCLACGAHIIRAPHVFVATHNPLVGRQSAVSAAFFQTNLALYTSCVLAARVKKPVEIVPGLFWDTAKPYHYVRTYEDGTGMTLIAGGEDYKTGQVADTRKPFEDLEHWFKKLAPHAKVTHRREILAQTDRAALIARRAVQGTAGRLRIGLAYWMDVTSLIEIVTRLDRRQPGIQLEMRQMSVSSQLTALGDERLDVGFVHPPIPKQLNGEIVASEPFVVALPFHHRLSMTPSIPLAALAHEPFILFPRESMSHLYDRAIEVCGEAGFAPNVREEIDQPDLMLRLVAAGLGISLVPSSARKAPRPGVAFRVLEPSRRVLDTAVAWPKHASPPVLAMFLEVVREVFNAASGLSRRGPV